MNTIFVTHFAYGQGLLHEATALALDVDSVYSMNSNCFLF